MHFPEMTILHESSPTAWDPRSAVRWVFAQAEYMETLHARPTVAGTALALGHAIRSIKPGRDPRAPTALRLALCSQRSSDRGCCCSAPSERNAGT